MKLWVAALVATLLAATGSLYSADNIVSAAILNANKTFRIKGFGDKISSKPFLIWRTF